MKTEKTVIPHVGMWIEIDFGGYVEVSALVIPHVGMWIEMNIEFSLFDCRTSSLT